MLKSVGSPRYPTLSSPHTVDWLTLLAGTEIVSPLCDQIAGTGGSSLIAVC